MLDESHFRPERKTGERFGADSPSGRWGYRCELFLVREGWSCGRGTIFEKATGRDVLALHSDDGSLMHGWVVHRGIELLLGSEQLVGGRACLDPANRRKATWNPTEKDQRKYHHQFIWAGPFALSPDEQTLAVFGCVWAALSHPMFYDFGDPFSLPHAGLPCFREDSGKAITDFDLLREGGGVSDALTREDACWNADGTFGSHRIRRVRDRMVVPAGLWPRAFSNRPLSS